MNFGESLGNSAMTGLLLALGYTAIKLFKRSKCASHTKCCDLDIARGQDTERTVPAEFHENIDEVVLRILESRTNVESPRLPEKETEGDAQEKSKSYLHVSQG